MWSDKKTTFLLLCWANLTISFNIGAIAAAIPVIAADMGFSDFLTARVIPYYLIPYGLGALIYAPLTRYFSYRRVLGFPILIFALSCLVCGLARDLQTILRARMVMGIAAASVIPMGLIVIGDVFERERRGRLLGIFFSSSFAASLAGIILSGTADWRWLFLIPAILGFLLSAALEFNRSPILQKKHQAEINYIRVLADLRVQKVFFLIFAMSFLYHGVHKWYGVYLSQVYDLDKGMISLFFVLTVAAGFAGQHIGGWISDKKGRIRACSLGLMGLGIGPVLLAGQYPLWILGLVLILIGMSWTIGHNGISTFLTDYPDRQRPALASLNSSVRFISGGLGFLVSGIFVEKSFGLTFFVIGILIILLNIVIKMLSAGHREDFS